MAPDEQAFPSEALLVERLLEELLSGDTAWGRVAALTEWDYGAGRTDVLARTQTGQLIAFEAKLANWKTAFFQAYRNTSFADLAYVVMPLSKAVSVKSQDLFSAQGVGLCGVGLSGVVKLIDARPGRMLMRGTRDRALTSLAGGMLNAESGAERCCGERSRRAPSHA